MAVVPIKAVEHATEQKTKLVESNQKALDALPLDSGTWRVEGVPGLYVRCRKQSKSFFLQRRLHGRLSNVTLGELSMKEARATAMRRWSTLTPKAAGGVATFESAFDAYLADKPLAEKTKQNYRYNLETYLASWKTRSLYDIGNDRAGLRALQRRIREEHGKATSNQIVRLLSAVYRWHRKIDVLLPESPTTAVEVDPIPPRDWAYSADELRQWWLQKKKHKDGSVVELGVSTLGAVKKMWWLFALLTGARKGSIEALKWTDIDFDRKTARFAITKGNRPYVVPLPDRLVEFLTAYRDSGEVPPSPWVFPSPVKCGEHIVGVKNPNEGVGPAHRLRHSYRTTLAQIGCMPDQARLLLGHAMSGDVSRNYVSAPLVIESLRPLANAVAEHVLATIGL